MATKQNGTDETEAQQPLTEYQQRYIQIMRDPTKSDWLKRQAERMSRRDIDDSVDDARLLLQLQLQRKQDS